MKFKLYTYDVWGNNKDGWEINDIHAALVGTILNCENVIIDIDPDNFTSYQIARKLQSRGIVWDYDYQIDGNYIYGHVKRNGKPVGELRPINDEGEEICQNLE